MTDNNNDREVLPDPMVMMLLAELHLYERLLWENGLTLDGLYSAYRFCTAAHPHNLVAGNASIVRERVLEGVINALAHTTGFPASHWTDRTIVTVPDTIAGLDDGNVS